MALLLAVLGVSIGLFMLMTVSLGTDNPEPEGATAHRAGAHSFLTRQGRQLYLEGKPYRFTGYNAFHLATLASRGIYGCGVESTDAQLDAFFASLRPNSLVRFWAVQRFAWNHDLKSRDWTAIDRVFDAAAKHGQRLVPVLGDQWGNCEGPTVTEEMYKQESWYTGTYRQVEPNGEGSTPLSYWDWVRTIVPRYASHPALGMWEPMNEGEAYTDPTRTVCSSTADDALRGWYDTVGGEIHRLDPNHLVSSGLGGIEGGCGADGVAYEYLHQSPGIDVGSYHDYFHDADPVSSEMQTRINQMARVGKPLIVGESGIKAGPAPDCKGPTTRRDQFKAKMDAQFAQGVDGILVWSWWPTDRGDGCMYENITAGDPTLLLVHDYPLEISDASPTTTTTTIKKRGPKIRLSR